jgi:hypothetical protein
MPKHPYGEMIYDKVAAIEKNRQKHRDAGDINNLAICVIESQGTKVKEQMEVLARALIDNEERLANAGEKGGLWKKAKAQDDAEQLLKNLSKCALSIKGKLTVKNVTQEWAKHSFGLRCPARNKLQELINLHSNLCSRPTR